MTTVDEAIRRIFQIADYNVLSTWIYDTRFTRMGVNMSRNASDGGGIGPERFLYVRILVRIEQV